MTDHSCTPQAPRLDIHPLSGVERNLVDDMIRSLSRPDAVVEQVTAGPKFIAVEAGGRMGIASLLGARHGKDETGMAEELIGMKAAQAAGLLREPSPFAVCLGLAALNAAVTPDPDSLPEENASAETLIAELGRNKAVGIVGDFPFTGALRETAGELHLFELRDVPGSVPRDRWEKVLIGLDVLAVTGTALLTRQMGYFLAQAYNAVSVVLGPSTPMSQSLFRFGADYLCGSVVVDPGPVLEGIRKGLPFRAIKKRGGIRFVRWAAQG